MIRNLFKIKSENLFEKDDIAKSITELSIRFPDYNIEQCGASFLNFESLESLSLQASVSYFNLIPEEVGAIKTLKKLEILNFNYKEFPKWILQLTNLEYLLFRGHDIECLPDSISTLIKLKYFGLENCAMKKLPESMRKMDNLVHLSLIDNFKLEPLDSNYLPSNLKKLAVKPSNISSEQKELIGKNRPKLRII